MRVGWGSWFQFELAWGEFSICSFWADISNGAEDSCLQPHVESYDKMILGAAWGSSNPYRIYYFFNIFFLLFFCRPLELFYFFLIVYYVPIFTPLSNPHECLKKKISSFDFWLFLSFYSEMIFFFSIRILSFMWVVYASVCAHWLHKEPIYR